MQLYDGRRRGGERSFGSCCSIDDLHDARRVAAAISIPHYILNFERQFNEQVVSNFVSEYAAGRTPLPCAHCNSDLKFATLARPRARPRRRRGRHRPLRARRARRRAGGYQLKRGVDAVEGPVVFPVLADAGPARARASSRRRSRRRTRSATTRISAACRSPTSRTARRSASSPTTTTRRSSPQRARTPRAGGAIVDESGRVLGTPRRHPPVHRRPAQGPRPRRLRRPASRCTCSRSGRTSSRSSWGRRRRSSARR